MIKFERLSKDAKATVVRNGVTQPVYLGMCVSAQELETLVVISGKVLYTVDEEQVIEVEADPKSQQVPEVQEPVAPVEDAKPVEAAPEPKKPVIVKPAPRTAKK